MTPIAATSNGETALSWVLLSWRQKNRCRLSVRARPVSRPAVNPGLRTKSFLLFTGLL